MGEIWGDMGEMWGEMARLVQRRAQRHLVQPVDGEAAVSSLAERAAAQARDPAVAAVSRVRVHIGDEQKRVLPHAAARRVGVPLWHPQRRRPVHGLERVLVGHHWRARRRAHRNHTVDVLALVVSRQHPPHQHVHQHKEAAADENSSGLITTAHSTRLADKKRERRATELGVAGRGRLKGSVPMRAAAAAVGPARPPRHADPFTRRSHTPDSQTDSPRKTVEL